MSISILLAAATGLAADSKLTESRPTPLAGWAYDPTRPVLVYFDDYDDDGILGTGGWYVQIGAGVMTVADSDGPSEDVEFDEGFAIPIAIGHRFGADDGNAFAFDLEFEAIYTDTDTDEGVLEAVSDVTTIAGLLNGVGEFSFGNKLGAYLGAGIGVAALDIGTQSDAANDFDEEDGPFLAWQAKAGLRLWSSEDLAWGLGYRFLNVDDAEIDDDIGGADFDLQTQQHILELNLRFQL